MHAEFVSVVDQLYPQRLSELTSSILSFAHAGIHNNRIGVITVTMDLADLCWSLLDCTKALGQAVLESAEELADQIRHPIETVHSMKDAIATAGYYFAKLLESTLHLEISPVDSNTLIIKADLDELIVDCKNFARAVGRTWRESPTPELVKQGTKLALQFYAFPKMLSALKAFVNKAVEQVPHYVKRIEKYSKIIAEGAGTEPMVGVALSQETVIPAIADKGLEIWEYNGDVPNNFVQYEKLKQFLQIKEFTSIIDVTEHGIQRLLERGIKPGDLLDALTRPDLLRIQSNGLNVYIKQAENKYNVFIINPSTKKLVTSMPGIDKKSLMKLGKNYEWNI